MKLTETEVIQRLKDLDGWQQQSSSLQKLYIFKDFATSVTFINLIVPVADGMNHHPDIRIYGWNNLEITVTTHDHGGITHLDFELAGKIDTLMKGFSNV